MSLEDTIWKLFVRIIFSVVVPAGMIVLCLYIFNSLADIKYIPASGLAFGVGFFIIYLMFKYWLKPDATKESSGQLWHFLVVFVINLAINIEIVYLLVSQIGVPILTAQTVAAVVIAYESYYAYLSLLYRESKKVVIQAPKSLADEIIFYDENGDKI